MIPRPPRSTLFPYTTLFRSKAKAPAVDDISFAVEPGEFFALLGPNGAGKTTTISILTTTLAKTGGHVIIAGYDLDTQARRSEEHTSELQSHVNLVCRLLLEK